MARSWFEVTVDVPAALDEAVGNFLLEQGSPGLQLDADGGRTRLTAYFAAAPPTRALRRFCAGAARIHVRRISEENWAENWKAHFPPLSVGERLYVCPPWAATAPPGRIALIIEPGMAFGTGQHASTRGCLRLIESATRAGGVTRALDAGTGSGILAIALAQFGVPEVWAIDSDPQAVAAAAANVRRNHVEARVRIGSDLAALPGTFDLAVANLFAGLLQELAPRLAAATRAGGRLICSGFLTRDAGAVGTAYAAYGFDIVERVIEEPWVSLALQRRGLQ